MPDRFISHRLYGYTERSAQIRVHLRSMISFTHTADIESRSKDHSKQEEDRDQHSETIPKLLQHSKTSVVAQ